MSGRPFVNTNPDSVSLSFLPSGNCEVRNCHRPVWDTPLKINHILWCRFEDDYRWYLYLDQILYSAPPVPSLGQYLRHYKKMSDAEVNAYLAEHKLEARELEEEFKDLFWDMTWRIYHSPSSLAYDYLWELDIPNDRSLGKGLLFEQEDGLLHMPRYVSTDDIFCLEDLQAKLFDKGVAVVLSKPEWIPSK